MTLVPISFVSDHVETLHEIADYRLSDFYGNRRPHVLPVGKQADNGAFEFTAVIGKTLSQELDDVAPRGWTSKGLADVSR